MYQIQLSLENPVLIIDNKEVTLPYPDYCPLEVFVQYEIEKGDIAVVARVECETSNVNIWGGFGRSTISYIQGEVNKDMEERLESEREERLERELNHGE